MVKDANIGKTINAEIKLAASIDTTTLTRSLEKIYPKSIREYIN